MIDTKVVSGETKWNVRNGLVMLLPHGYDGNGPEHSSARLERFLQLSDAPDKPSEIRDQDTRKQTNIIVANASTSAQYFHLLRSQIRRDYRKPLIVMSPKKLLKFKAAGSPIEDFGAGLRFHKVLEDNSSLDADATVRKVVYCSGQVYYDLEAKRAKEGITDVAIVRVEQIAPFPFRSLRNTATRFPNAVQCWAQEEPKNAGAWNFVEPRFRAHLKDQNHNQRELQYAGRPINASTATGYGALHKQELENLLEAAFA